MKLAIRHADKVVGVSVVAALGVVVLVLFMLVAVNQRLFRRDADFFAYFDTAMGLSQNMAVQHMGLTVGQVRAFEPVEGEMIRVRFVVFEEYLGRVRGGSRVELVASQIPLFGNSFTLFPGDGEPLEPGSVIQSVRMPDVVGAIIDDVGGILGEVNAVLAAARGALDGTGPGPIGDILRSVSVLVEDLSQTLGDVVESAMEVVMAELAPVFASIAGLVDGLADQEVSLLGLLEGEDGGIRGGLVETVDALAGVIHNLEEATALIPPQFPQIAALLTEVNVAVRTANDVLVSVGNLPVIRSGMPGRVETGPGGTFVRDMEF